MAKLIAPMLSIEARGSVGKAITFSVWKGIPYARQWFIPQNPKDPKQVNVRAAWILTVLKWQSMTTQADLYDAAAKGKPYSGFNLMMSRVMKEYAIQLTTSVPPVGVTVTGNYPDEVITWSDE